jgi:hypothetical protein
MAKECAEGWIECPEDDPCERHKDFWFRYSHQSIVAPTEAPQAQDQPSEKGGTVSKDEILKGLQAGRKLRCDRKDEPLLPWLLGHPDIGNKFIQHDEQSSCIEFWWKPKEGTEK